MAGPKSGEEIAQEIADLENENLALRKKYDDKEEELRVMWESKLYHKRISHENLMKLNQTIIDLTSERTKHKTEREKDAKTIANMMDDNGKYATDVLELTEEVREKTDKLERQERRHKTEMEELTKRYDAQGESYQDMVNRKDTKLQKEKEIQKKSR